MRLNLFCGFSATHGTIVIEPNLLRSSDQVEEFKTAEKCPRQCDIPCPQD